MSSRPAKDITTHDIHTVRFPGESAGYRKARNELLRAEMALRRTVEEVAALRRGLPLGGEVPMDYVFQEGAADLKDTRSVRATKLSELFERGESLIAYSFMFSPNMKAACPMCTAMLDGLHGNVRHASQRTNVVVIAKSPIARIRELARERGWTDFHLLSSADTTYNRDYGAENERGAQMPALNVFVKRKGKVYHYYNTELLFAPSESGQDPRHVDLLWPLWNLLDLTPEGRGGRWYPKLSY